MFDEEKVAAEEAEKRSRRRTLLALSAIAGAALLLPSDGVSAALLAAIFVSTLPTRQLLMPAVNAATDAGAKRRFQALHGVSVVITLAHIAASGFVLARFLADRA